MQKITVYVEDKTKEIIDEMVKEEKRSVSFIADKLICKGIKEATRKRKSKNDPEQED